MNKILILVAVSSLFLFSCEESKKDIDYIDKKLNKNKE
jgi:hypothetical protein